MTSYTPNILPEWTATMEDICKQYASIMNVVGRRFIGGEISYDDYRNIEKLVADKVNKKVRWHDNSNLR